jgi:hypothetical protein
MDDPKATVEAWHMILKDYDFDEVGQNLKNHVESSSFAPTIADLVKKHTGRSIPGVKETQLLITQYERAETASKEVVEEELAKIRKILGIKREG